MSTTTKDSLVHTRVQRRRGSFYVLLTLAMTCTAFLGFWFTYFGPIFDGNYPTVSPIVHVHGWSFFAWFLLLPTQAGLIRSGRIGTHRIIGLGTVSLGVVMVVVGLIVSAVQVDLARQPDGDPFWRLMGVPIFTIWMLFTFFYAAAIYRRRNPTIHKQFIVLASAAALSAATFRILVRLFGFAPWVAVVGCLAPAIFVLLAATHEYRKRGSIGDAYLLRGGATMIVMIGGAFLLGAVPDADFAEEGIGWIGEVLSPLYPQP